MISETQNYAFLLKTEMTIKEKPVNPGLQRKGNYVPNNISRVYGTYNSVRIDESIYYATPKSGVLPLAIYSTTDGKCVNKYLDKKMLADLTQSSFSDVLKKCFLRFPVFDSMVSLPFLNSLKSRKTCA